MSTIEIRKISITDLNTDAIVNAANDGLWAGGGVCGAIFKAAGYQQLQAACNKIGHCDTGSAVITPGFHLKAKYIIHAVGPRWKDGKHKEPEQLYGAYYRSLELAVENKCRSIGFPLISAGIFGYPMKAAWQQALSACNDFLDNNKSKSLDIVFAVLDNEIIKAGRKILKDRVDEKYRIADRGDWNIQDMPKKRATFILDRHFRRSRWQRSAGVISRRQWKINGSGLWRAIRFTRTAAGLGIAFIESISSLTTSILSQ